MRVICINAGPYGGLTHGKVYGTVDVLSSAGWMTVINDNGEQAEYFSTRFAKYTPVPEVPICGADTNDDGYESAPIQKPVDLLEATRKFLGR